MTNQYQKTIVGVFALSGLVVLGILMLLFGGGQSLFASTYDINVHFPKGVVGVQEGQSVTLNGKRIGETKSVDFWDADNLEEGIRVIVSVDEQHALPKACRVQVATSIMGFGRPAIGVLVTDPDETEKLQRDGSAEIFGEMVKALDQVLPPETQDTLVNTADSLGKLADAATPLAEALTRVSDNLEKILSPRTVEQVDLEGATATFATAIERADGLMKNMDDAFKNLNAVIGDAKSREDLRIMLANLRKMSEDGREMTTGITALTTEGQRLARDTSQLVRRFTESVDTLSKVLERVDSTFAALNSKDGTAGSFLNDNRLYEELLLSAKRLTKALDEMREVLDIMKRGELVIKPF